jgi:hypothetical protein
MMMSLPRRPAIIAMPNILLLFVFVIAYVAIPTASALFVPSQEMSTRCQGMALRKHICHHRDGRRTISAELSPACTQTQRSLTMMKMMDVTTDQHSVQLAMDLHASSTFDWLSSFTLAKASSSIAIVPNQSIAPLSETIQSIFDATTSTTTNGNPNNNLLEVIPDLPSMPGGVPRSGNAFLSGSFRDLYQAPMVTPNPKMFSNMLDNGSGGSMAIPSRELDVVARYADLLSRIPPMAAAYALFDFFVINAEEDVAIAELLVGDGEDDDDYENDEAVVAAIMDVENRVVMQRFMGLFAIVAVTVMWSLLSYHPVPFNEL